MECRQNSIASAALGVALLILLAGCGESNITQGISLESEPVVLAEEEIGEPLEPKPPLPPVPEPIQKPEPLSLNPPSTEGPIRVALLLPLTGPERVLGRTMLDAATLAMFEVGSEKMILMPRDTKGDASIAREVAEEVLQEGVELILGPLFSESVTAVSEPARLRGVNIVAFSNDSSVAGNGVHLLAFLPQQQIDRVVSFAVSQGIRKFGILAPETAYGIKVVDSLRIAALQSNGELTDVSFYKAGASDAMAAAEQLANYKLRRDQLMSERRTLRAAGNMAALARLDGRDTLGDPTFDAVMLPEGGGALRQVAPLLPFFDIDPLKIRFLGTGLWDDPTIGKEPALIGGWFAAAPPESILRFNARFADVFGYRPLRMATLAYDAVALAAALPNFSSTEILSPHGFVGTDGIFRFLPNGVVDRGLAILEVHKDGPIVIDPAPLNFTQLTNN